MSDKSYYYLDPADQESYDEYPAIFEELDDILEKFESDRPGWQIVCHLKHGVTAQAEYVNVLNGYLGTLKQKAIVGDDTILVYNEPKTKTKTFDVSDYTEQEQRLCTVLAEKIEANEFTVKNPLTKTWLQASRKLIKRADELGADETKIIRLMDWALEHNFWSGNIRSMPKFFEQYETLRKQAIEEAKLQKAKENSVPRNRLTTHKDIAAKGISAAFDPSDPTKTMS